MNNTILVVDDEKEIRHLLEINLINEGYNVFKASCGQEALDILNREEISLMVLDIMMPGMDGLEVCKIARENHNIPILMLSAKTEDMDKIQGIMTGADDYVCKPFNSLELMVRIRALLRRAYFLNTRLKISDEIIRIESIVIDKKKHRITIEGKEVSFTAREFEIIYLLATNRGRVFSAEEIFERVWKERYFQSNNTVMVHMSRIRDKIEQHMAGANIIHTVWGVGYKIEK
ncbi:response regulator transcription factor [Clostridium sp. AL.422]|uniref:response regulator transcription factor n=1 Tax=Clostridium TaxID=1485 RepID=UPI00293DCFBE|nr:MULTISPECIES: response regulator transcription factor [unclassified Clostridium]MDV4149590.1 response regulator transcription factor [Clostridium sp. AL.422]